MKVTQLKNNKSGFTLLEIIIVIIIIGVLASLALPKLFATVERSKAAEALAAIGSIRSAIARCELINSGTFEDCDNFDNLDMVDPSTQPGSHFDYTFGTFASATYRIIATRNTYDNGSGDTSCVITVDYDATGVTKTGAGTCQGI